MKKKYRNVKKRKKQQAENASEIEETSFKGKQVKPAIFHYDLPPNSPIYPYNKEKADELSQMWEEWEKEVKRYKEAMPDKLKSHQTQEISNEDLFSDSLENKSHENDSEVIGEAETSKKIETEIVYEGFENITADTNSYQQADDILEEDFQPPTVEARVPPPMSYPCYNMGNTTMSHINYCSPPVGARYDLLNQTAMFNPSFIFGENVSFPNSTLGNFTLIPVQRRIFIDRFGNEISERQEILTRIEIEGQTPELFMVHPKELKRLGSIVSEKFVFAYLNDGIKNVEKKLTINFRNDLRMAKTENVYVDYGWQMINGIHVYAHDGLNPSIYGVFQTGRVLPCDNRITPGQVGDIVVGTLHLYREPNVIHVIQLFSMLGISFSVFNEAGFPPRFLLFIDGPTGSMKTTLSDVLFVQVRDEEGYGNKRRFQDTLTSLEIGFVQNGRGTVTLVDDYSPPKTPNEEREKADKIELLLRMAGDGLGKGRSNSQLEDHKGQRVEGVVAVTGELICTGTSSKLRCFFCPMEKGKMDLNILGTFQRNPNLYSTFLNHYAIYLGSNWDACVEYIRSETEKERKAVGAVIREPRIVDDAVILRLQAAILGDFLINYCGREASEVNGLINAMRESVIQIAVQSEARSVDEPLAQKIIRAINTLLVDGSFRIIGHKPDETDFSDIDGYTEKGFIYFRPERFYSKVSRMLAKEGVRLTMDSNQLVTLLIQEGIAVPSPNGHDKDKQKITNLTRVVLSKKLRVQLIKMRQDRLNAFNNNES